MYLSSWFACHKSMGGTHKSCSQFILLFWLPRRQPLKMCHKPHCSGQENGSATDRVVSTSRWCVSMPFRWLPWAISGKFLHEWQGGIPGKKKGWNWVGGRWVGRRAIQNRERGDSSRGCLWILSPILCLQTYMGFCGSLCLRLPQEVYE